MLKKLFQKSVQENAGSRFRRRPILLFVGLVLVAVALFAFSWSGNKESDDAMKVIRHTISAKSKATDPEKGFLQQTIDQVPVPDWIRAKAEATAVPSATVKYFMINLYGLDGNRFTEEQVREWDKLAQSYVKQFKQSSSQKQSPQKTIDDIYRDDTRRLEEGLVRKHRDAFCGSG